jgi:hypothetical protein
VFLKVGLLFVKFPSWVIWCRCLISWEGCRFWSFVQADVLKKVMVASIANQSMLSQMPVLE